MIESFKDVGNGDFYEGSIKLKYNEIGWFEVYHVLIDEMGILTIRFSDLIQKLVTVITLYLTQIFI